MFASDAAGLLRTAIRSRGITLYPEPKFLYNSPMARTSVPSEFAVPFGKARRRREGTDLTIAAYGTPVHFALEAAQALEKEGRSVEVVDLRSLVPLDLEAVAASVRKTSRLLVAHEDKVHGGFGGEIASQIQETVFWPPPIQRPRIPIWVAGHWSRSKGPFRRAARYDGVCPEGIRTLADQRAMMAYIRRHRSSDAAFDAVRFAGLPAGDPGQVRASLHAWAEAGITW